MTSTVIFTLENPCDSEKLREGVEAAATPSKWSPPVEGADTPFSFGISHNMDGTATVRISNEWTHVVAAHALRWFVENEIRYSVSFA